MGDTGEQSISPLPKSQVTISITPLFPAGPKRLQKWRHSKKAIFKNEPSGEIRLALPEELCAEAHTAHARVGSAHSLWAELWGLIQPPGTVLGIP